MSLGGGSIDLGCTDISVGGNLQIGSSAVFNIHNVTIQAGAAPNGTLDGGSGSFSLAGNWSNSGNFTAGTSTTSFIDNPGCATGSAFSGNTSFYNLSLVSALGKVYTIPPGSTQTTLASLTIQGTLANPIRIVSGVAGSRGNMNLVPGGTQNIAHVGVSDNWATGQALAPLLSNEGGTGNANGWFGAALIAAPTPIPALGPAGMALLALMMAGFGMFFVRGRTQTFERE